MSIPAGITSITVTGKFVDASGNPLAGYVTFTPSITAADTTDKTIVPMAPVRVNLDETGAISKPLASTDDPQWAAPGWTYAVKIHLDVPNMQDRTYSIQVPAASVGGTLDLSAALPEQLPGTPSQFLLKSGGVMSGDITFSDAATVKKQATDQLKVDSGGLVVNWADQSQANIAALPVGPTGKAKQTGIQIPSSFAGGEDISSGEDSTGRINLYSYQRAASHSFGESIRMWAMRQDSKQMIAWYGAQKTGTQEDGYDNTTRDVLASGVSWKPWAWIGAHYEANDHASVHGHISIEVPDTTGALQTRLEILFADRTTGLIGLDKTFVITNQSDFVVRCSNTQVLRLAAAAGTAKAIEFSNDSFGAAGYTRWKIRQNADAEAGSSAGSDFEIVRYNDAGTAVDAPIKVLRAGSGNVQIGASSSATLVAQGRVTIGTTTPNARKLYVEEPTGSNAAVQIKATADGTTSVAVVQNEIATVAKRFEDWRVTADNVSRAQMQVNASGGGELSFSDGSSGGRATIYWAAASTLKTDVAFHVGTTFRHLGTSLGFYNAAAVAKPTVTGSRGSNAALASLITALANLGLVTDSSS